MYLDDFNEVLDNFVGSQKISKNGLERPLEVIEANYLEVAEEVSFLVGSSKNDVFDGVYTKSSTSQLSTS